MRYAIRSLGLVSCLALVSTLTACTGNLGPRAARASTSSSSSSPAAYVYIQTQSPGGPVYGFSTSPSGQLSAIPGSPFAPAGEIFGGTPTMLFTLGDDSIHSYGVGSDGAIESQLSQISVFDYSGNGCPSSTSAAHGAVLDPTGEYVYVVLYCGGDNLSVEYQSYLINSDGALSYSGSASLPASWYEGGYAPSLPSILGNESFAYADEIGVHGQSVPIGFRRTSSGTLELMQFTETDPTPNRGAYDAYGPPDASPTGNYLVVPLYLEDSNPAQFGSYTVDSNGNISTANTESNMPTSSIVDPNTAFSPSGDLFVAYGGQIEVYMFNGAAPLTLWQTLLSGNTVQQVAFDLSNHLYALSSDTLYAFTATSTSIAQTSSVKVSSPYKMVIVSE